MKRSKKVLIITVVGFLVFFFTLFLAKKFDLNMTAILAIMSASSFVIASIMIVRAHSDETLLKKARYSNFAGGFIELFLYSLVMLIVWLIFDKKVAFYQSILITYPSVRFVSAFVDNKFYKFLDQFVFYRRFEEQKKAELQLESQKKAQAKKRLAKKG